MPLQKEPLRCIPVLPIKNQIEQIGFDIKLGNIDISPETWNRYPCDLNNPMKCRRDHCKENVSFFININARKCEKILKLFFIRENESAYVQRNRQLRSLFEDEILNPIPSVTILLNPPIESEPTKKVFMR